MLHFLRVATVSISFLFLCSCATTSLSTYTDPAFADVTFDSVAIWADMGDLEWRQDLETRMQQRMATKTGAKATRVIDIAPPTRGYNVDEVFQLMRGVGIQAVLVVAFTETGIKQTISGSGDGVQTYNKPWGEATVDLYHVESGNKIWTGNATTRGDAFTDWEEVRRSAGTKIIAGLLADGLLPPPSE